VHIYDLTPQDELQWLNANGYVREVFHPSEPLALLNYTDRAMVKPELFEQYPSLNHTRGLIYDLRDGTIVARPFKKFWNHGQPQAPQIPLDAHVIVTDKVDGSLGILYWMPVKEMYAIATRGSFTSDQAVHATEVLWSRYRDFAPLDDDTLLFEIVYPENRIVLDYGHDDDLFLLGSVEKARGFVNSPDVAAKYHGWQGPRAKTLAYSSLAQALAAPPRPNAEGMVVRQPTLDEDRMVKIKQEDYLELHRIVFSLSTRSIWAALRSGKSQAEILEPLPDEFHGWVLDVVYELWTIGVAKRYRDLVEQYRNTMRYAHGAGLIERDDDSPGGYYVEREKRGALARLFQESDDAWAMFALLDGKDIMDRLWRDAEPPASQTPSTYEPGKS
jgi:RNA ligase